MTMIKSMKAKVATVMAAGFLAGAFVMAAPKAEAQGFAVGVRFGGPRYVAPRAYGYYGPRYVAPPVVYGRGYYHYDHFHRGYWR
jgi:hypothetical protein